MAIWLVVLVLAIVCFVIGFTVAAKALFVVGLVLLAVAAGGSTRSRRRGSLVGGTSRRRTSWRRRGRSLI